MKKIYLCFFLVLIISGCQKDEISAPIPVEGIQEELEKEEGPIQNIEFKDLPVTIRQKFDDRNFIKQTSNQKNVSIRIGKAKTDIPALKVKNKYGRYTYTIALSKSKQTKSNINNSLYFDNYVVKELEDGGQK
ncbi:hypothetical protein [Christiangramia echinicola]|uniref:hypothetical protein n=1 Tax=Christiangramia echinicola TaxID=279359 RepID=UPI00047B17F2|nr:hypothetical protein [Christiangramia echinicola]